MINEIKVPEILIEQKNYCLKIDQNNTKLFHYVQYLKQLVTNMHRIYQDLCRNMTQTLEEYQRKIVNNKYTSHHALVILNFVKNINFLHLSINNQLNTNNISLATKSHKIAKKRLEILRDKLLKCNELNREYLAIVEIFNSKEKSFRQKCEYFNDYEKDVLKYYSLKANTQRYEKLSVKQLKLKERLQEIIRSKDEYKANISEIKVTIREYYEMELNIVSQYKKLLLNIRKSSINNNQVYNQPIIQEESQDAYSTVMEEPLSKRSEKAKDKTIVQLRKEIIREFQRCMEVEEILEDLMKVFQSQIENTGRNIDSIRFQKEYQNFISEKLIMSEILPAESMKEIDMIINEISFFRSIVLKLTNVFGKTKVLAELKKYRGFNFDKFVEDTNHLAEAQRKHGFSIDLKLQYKQYQQKFNSSHNEYNVRYQQRIIQIQNLIYSHYYMQDQILQENKQKRNLKSNLFQKKYYEIIMIPFFLNKMDNTTFIQNVHLKKFSNHLNANKIQKMMTLTGFYSKEKKARMKATCCGLVRKEDDEEGPKLIDEFHCALKDGMILIQGKLKIYENYLNFASNFNSKTLFGYSDIRIPKWDINNFSKDRHLLSLVIIVQTNHGSIYFTSFISNPFQELQNAYSNRKSGMSIAQYKNTGESELQILEARFQSELRAELKRKSIIIDKLSTYLSQDCQSLSICIEYHLNGTEETILFEIKMNYSEITLEYMFIHDDIQKSHEVRATLESVSKELINKKPDNSQKEKKQKVENNVSLDLQYSIIEQNQKNKISFLKEPSFINRRSDNEDMLRSSQVQLGQLLTSRNFLSNQETSKNIEMMQQRILFSDGNESVDSKLAPLPTIKPFNTQSSIQDHTFSPKQEKVMQNPQLKSRRKTSTVHSRKSSQNSSHTQKPYNYNTIMLFLGILLGLNLLLNYFT